MKYLKETKIDKVLLHKDHISTNSGSQHGKQPVRLRPKTEENKVAHTMQRAPQGSERLSAKRQTT